MSDPRLGFAVYSESWYAVTERDFVDEIMVGMYDTDDGCEWEFGIRWSSIGGKAIPRVEVFDDAWCAFAEIPELFEVFASLNNGKPTVDTMKVALLEFGAVDDTKREVPGRVRHCKSCGQAVRS